MMSHVHNREGFHVTSCQANFALIILANAMLLVSSLHSLVYENTTKRCLPYNFVNIINIKLQLHDKNIITHIWFLLFSSSCCN